MLSHHHSLFNPFTHMLSHFIIQPHPCTLHDGSHILSLAVIFPLLIIHPPINKHRLQPQRSIHTHFTSLPFKAVHFIPILSPETTPNPCTSHHCRAFSPILAAALQPFLHTNTTPKPVLRPCAATKRRTRGPKRSYNSI
ncbi:S2-RNase [Pyrus ussuriensis x Pyrus communis]|uniref:S2-RNase n=1 Tax=Pyrus ussuriensis x Pyrus communis TaxID=2448454 RepID=A0A5N5FAK5_9ROSA|nr:S2-RNase [Pyrus ussuriensis x Pyrus communis]